MTSDYEQLSELQAKRARERLQAITPGQGDATLPLDDKFMVTRALMQEVAALKTENARLKLIEKVSSSAFDTLQLCYETRQSISREEAGFIAYSLLRNVMKGHADE